MLGHSCGNIWHDILLNALGLVTSGVPFVLGIQAYKFMWKKHSHTAKCSHKD